MDQETPFLIRRFQSMGCPCEVLLDTTDATLADDQLNAAIHEAERIEQKYSRYRQGTIVDRINTSQGKKVKVDDETAAILDYADECYEMSDGLFDITTGVLRMGAGPSRVGWDKVSWKQPFIRLPPEFEIDFGGICKEYAADRILSLLIQRHDIATLVNLGGDIAAAGNRLWSVGIEDVSHPGQVARTIRLRKGGVATSGTTKRPGHILNPKTGQPVTKAPESVTVAARTCTEAGFWSTLAVLHGEDAEAFLKEQALEFWCFRTSPLEPLRK
jgi:FAD:protein FMN transferase